MIMTIRNTCRMLDNLFQLVGNREMKSLNSPNISVVGLEPVSVVYVEVTNIKNFSVWVCSQQRLMAGRKMLNEGEQPSGRNSSKCHPSRDPDIFRCFQVQVGSSHSGPVHLWNVVTGRDTLAHQSPRVESSTSWSISLPGEVGGPQSGFDVQHHHVSILHQQMGRRSPDPYGS